MGYQSTAAWYRAEASAHRRAMRRPMDGETPYRFGGVRMTREEALGMLEAGKLLPRDIWTERPVRGLKDRLYRWRKRRKSGRSSAG